MSYNIIQKRKIWLSISGLLVALSLAAIIAWGLNLGIDFTGGSLLEVDFKSARPSAAEIQENLKDLGLGSLTAQPSGDNGVILRFQDISEEKHQLILEKLNIMGGENQIDELRFDSVGPSIGQELKRKSVLAIIIVLIAIVLYIAWTFRKVSKPVASWKYGLAAIIALFHDV
ncbi:protein translocase subunit SecF, partial [Candidatus Falkowbacteria bacterium]|nr:protein translocase subunit SecF [Candidatus Falkowbacteria bacterium]